MANHKPTPTPWTYNGVRSYTIENGAITVHSEQPYEKFVIKFVWEDEQGSRYTRYVATVPKTAGYEDEAEATADFIVTCANSHVAMAEAIQQCAITIGLLKTGMTSGAAWGEVFESEYLASLKAIKKALEMAGG